MPKEFEPREIREFIGREKSEHFSSHQHTHYAHPHPQHHDFSHHWGDDDDDDDNNPLVQLVSFLGSLFS